MNSSNFEARLRNMIDSHEKSIKVFQDEKRILNNNIDKLKDEILYLNQHKTKLECSLKKAITSQLSAENNLAKYKRKAYYFAKKLLILRKLWQKQK